MKRRLVLAACLAAASSYVRGQEFKISKGPEVKVSQDDDVDLKSFTTFAWVENQEPAENPALAPAAEVVFADFLVHALADELADGNPLVGEFEGKLVNGITRCGFVSDHQSR